MPEEKEAEVTAADGAVKDKSKSVVMIFIILSILVMVLTPVITVMAVKMLSQQATKTLAKAAENHNSEIDLGITEVNVGDTNATRMVQVDIVAEINNDTLANYFKEQSVENKDGKQRIIKSMLITILSSKTLEGLVSPEAKDKLAKEIKDKLNEYLGKFQSDGMVTNIYFTKFIIQ